MSGNPTIYDDQLKQRLSHLTAHPTYMPYIGRKFQNTNVKVVIIGESHYLPAKFNLKFSSEDWYTNPELIYEQLSAEDVGWIDTREVLNFYQKSPRLSKGHTIYRNLDIAFNEIYPNNKLFEECAYMNYFQRPAEKEGETINANSTDQEIAYKTLLLVTEILKPNKLIFVSQKAFESFKNNLQEEDKADLPFFTSVPHPSASSWWNRKSKKYGLNSKGETATGKEKFQRIITKK